jgi:8-oxo-dGTP pyrophosphatase MutT (NUDIX family)
MIKHATSSTFVFHRFSRGWRLGLVVQPRLGRHMIVGGHVEANETQAEAAVREAVEESGLQVRLLACPTPALPVGYPHAHVPAPWWINEIMVPADNHLDEPHVHVDHQYVAVAESADPVREAVHPFDWYAMGDLDGLDMFEDTRMLARALFPIIGSITAAEGDPAGLLRVLASSGMC